MKVSRMSKEELRNRLHSSSIAIIDVRKDQENAKFKIKTAKLQDPDDVDSWAHKYDKDQTLVLYCS